jgi:hypothetical protein
MHNRFLLDELSKLSSTNNIDVNSTNKNHCDSADSEKLKPHLSWGSVLDAGTGTHSLDWICSLPTERWVAITGDDRRRDAMLEEFDGRMRDVDAVLSDNWNRAELLHREKFDVVIADYLVGAMDVSLSFCLM